MHPNLVNATEVIATDSRESFFLVMEYCENNLWDIVRAAKSPFMASEVKCWMQQLTTAVHYIHSMKIIHRDIKLANILINNRGRLKLCDFGLSVDLAWYTPRHGGLRRKLTQHVVTLWYRPPEIMLGLQYDESIDMWGVGLIFADLLLLRPLLPGKSEVEQLEKTYALLGTDGLLSSWPEVAQAPLWSVHSPKKGLVSVFHDLIHLIAE